jgi:hypothetical protein
VRNCVRIWQSRACWPAIVFLLLVALVAGCTGTIDGFVPGSIVKCSGGIGPIPPGVVTCGDYPRLAIGALDTREPGHAAIVQTEMFSDGRVPGPIDVTGDGPPPTPNHAPTNWSITVFVFTLADGSKRATGVLCVKDVATHQSSCAGIGRYPG